MVCVRVRVCVLEACREEESLAKSMVMPRCPGPSGKGELSPSPERGCQWAGEASLVHRLSPHPPAPRGIRPLLHRWGRGRLGLNPAANQTAPGAVLGRADKAAADLRPLTDCSPVPEGRLSGPAARLDALGLWVGIDRVPTPPF